MKKSKRTSSNTSNNLNEKDVTFLIEQYRVLSSDRINHNELFWNVPIMFLSAQSFLLVIALGGFVSVPWQRAVGAFISFVFGFLSIQIFERNRINEIADAEQMLDIETYLVSNGYTGTEIHQPNQKRKYLNGEDVEKRLNTKGLLKILNRGVSYKLWRNGMFLVTTISGFLFFYNLFSYFDKYFPYISTSGFPVQFDSFRYFISTLDKNAVSIIIALVFYNWVIFNVDSILKAAPVKKKPPKIESASSESKKSSKTKSPLKVVSLIELILLLALILLTMIFRYFQIYFPQFIWEVVLVLSIFVPFIFIVRFVKQSNRANKERSDTASRNAIIGIILAGGNSQRLQSKYPKIIKFKDILVSNQSLIINTILRNNNIMSQQSIVTTYVYGSKIQDLLDYEKQKPQSEINSNINIIAEPSSRGTATAIYFYLWCSNHDESLGLLDDPILVFLPSDQLIPDITGYKAAIDEAIKHAGIFPHIYLIGTSQTEDASFENSHLYGYIQANKGVGPILKVEHFVEKPTRKEVAKLRSKSSLYLNMGVFIARRSVFMRSFTYTSWPALREFSSCRCDKHEIELLYNVIPESSYEKDVLEKVPNLYVIPATHEWIDVGDSAKLETALEAHLCQLNEVFQLGN